MKDLNSTLIEGTAHHIVYRNNDTPETFFELTSQRGEDTATLSIIAHRKLADTCHEYLKENDRVRVIGHLAQQGSEIYIIAEHIEIKPPQNWKGN